MIRMPGESYSGCLPPLSESENAFEAALRETVFVLADDIGERNVLTIRGLRAAAEYIETQFSESCDTVRREEFDAGGLRCANVVAEIPGLKDPEQIVVIGAHYDTVEGSSGANDNGSGVASLLALAHVLRSRALRRTLRMVAFANEEAPFFGTEAMGSLVHAKGCRSRAERVLGMMSLETIGYYDDQEGSQDYPSPLRALYPSTGDFVGFVGNLSSDRLVRRVVRSFRSHTQFPSEGAALPEVLEGVSWSDHWAFWECGYPSLMVTDDPASTD